MLIISIIGFICINLCAICLISLHILPSGLNPIRDYVSTYARTKYRFLYSIQAITSGVCGFSILILLIYLNKNRPMIGLLSLLCYSISRILIAFFKIDDNKKKTLSGILHTLLATITFCGIAIGASTLTPMIKVIINQSIISSILNVFSYIIVISASLFILAYFVKVVNIIPGLIERLIYLGTVLWFYVFFIAVFSTGLLK